MRPSSHFASNEASARAACTPIATHLTLLNAACFIYVMKKQHAVNSTVQLLSSGEAAALVGVARSTLWRWEKAGQIESLRTPTGQRRYRRSDVEELLTPASQVGDGKH